MDKVQHNIKRKINKIYREKGRFPTEQEMNNILSYNNEQTRNYMKALEDEGVVVRKGDWYVYPEENIVEPVPIEQVILKIDEEQKHLIPIDSKSLSEEPIDSKKETSEPLTLEKLESLKEPSTSIPPSESLPPSESKPEYEEFVELNDPEKAEQREKIKEKIRKKYEKIIHKSLKKKKSFLKQTKEDLTLPMYIIRFVMLIIGTGSIIISIYYNIKLSMHFLPGIFAVISGCIFVLFAVVSFETIIYFIIYRMATWKKFIAISGFIFLWLIVTLFSVSAVLSGRFERYMLNEKSQYSDNRAVNAGRLRWQNVQEQKKDTEKQITEKRRQLEQLYKISEGIADLETRKENDEVFKNTQWRISVAEGDIRTLIAKLDNIRKLELKQIEENPETTDADIRAGENDDFYTWLAGIFGSTKERIHFAISLIPALFFDLISSISISIFLFLRK